MKKIISITMCLCLILSTFTFTTASAQTDESSFCYESYKGEYWLVSGYNGTDKDVVIPSYAYGRPVVGIADQAFDYNDNIRSVVIPEGITIIFENAFFDCDGLNSVKFPSTLEKIELGAFHSCNWLYDVTLPENIKEVGRGAFSDCNLQEVYIPASLTTIDATSFCNNHNMDSITVDEENPNYCSVDGVLFSKDMKILIDYPIGKKETEYIVPDGVTTIGEHALAYSGGAIDVNYLEKIVLPDSVTKIECLGIFGCTLLKEIVMPKELESIGFSAFKHCRSLETITIPEGVKTIPESAFYYCSNLEEITLPESLTTIENLAFAWCRDLEKIKIPTSVTSIADDSFSQQYLKSIVSEEDSFAKVFSKEQKFSFITTAEYEAKLQEIAEQEKVTAESTTQSVVTPIEDVVENQELSAPNLKLSKSSKKIFVKYTKVDGADGYQIRYRKANGKWKIKTYNSNRCIKRVLKKLKSNARYKVKVRAFANIDGIKIFGIWSKTKSITIK